MICFVLNIENDIEIEGRARNKWQLKIDVRPKLTSKRDPHI